MSDQHEPIEQSTVFPLGDVKIMMSLMSSLEPCVDCSSMPAIHLVIDNDKYVDGHDWDAVLLHDRGCPALAAERAKRAGLPPTKVHP